MDETDSSSTDPFVLFASECSDLDIQVRIHSMQRLQTVAVALGVEKTKSELILYLDTITEGIYNDDEVLLCLAEQLGSFLPFVGGAENAALLLNILEKLGAVEEMLVRNKAVESLQKICRLLDAAAVQEVFVPLVLRLADSEWFTSKSTSAALFSVCYTTMPEDVRADLRNAYRVLCQDESPMVRRSAASKFVDFAKVLEVDHLKDEFIPVFDNLSQDDQDSVRVLAIEVGISLAERLKKKEIEDFILVTLTDLCNDASWRVRYQVARQINPIQLVLGHELTRKHLLAIYHNLVHDMEPQVREASAGEIVRFCEILQQTFTETDGADHDTIDPVILNEVFPLIQFLDQDVNPEVKEALSLVITSLSPLLGVEYTKNLLLPLITNSLLNDSSKVRENIISNLNSIISVIGITDIADTVLKIVVDLVNSSTSVWRTRRNLIVTINYIAKQSGKEYFDAHLKAIYQKLLNDGVYAVRKTAPLILPILAKTFGFDWAKKSIAPLFLIFAEHRHYLYRFVCLFCINELVTPTLEAKFKQEEKSRHKFLSQVCESAANLPENVRSLLKRLKNLNDVLKIRLAEQWVADTLELLEEDDIEEDDIKRYAEDTIDMFIKDNDLSITNISEEEICFQGSNIYLEGLLDLISCKCMLVLRGLAKDPVPNIRIKVAKTLQNIIKFSQSLEKELNEEWASNMLGDDVKDEMEESHPEEQNLETDIAEEIVEADEIRKEEIEETSNAEQGQKIVENESIEILEEKLSANGGDS